MAARKARPRATDDPHHDEAVSGETPREFRYQVTRASAVFVFWRGRRVFTATGSAAERLLARLEGIDADAQQMVLAKATGNFKRGNERR